MGTDTGLELRTGGAFYNITTTSRQYQHTQIMESTGGDFKFKKLDT